MTAAKALMETCAELLTDSQAKVAEATAPIAARNQAKATKSFLDRAEAVAMEMVKENERVFEARTKIAMVIQSCGARIREATAMRHIRRQELVSYARKYQGDLHTDLEDRGKVTFDRVTVDQQYWNRYDVFASGLGLGYFDDGVKWESLVDALVEMPQQRGARRANRRLIEI